MLLPRGNVIRLLRHAVRVHHGSISTKMAGPPHVRFSPVSDRTADIAGGPFRAKDATWLP